MKSTPRKCLLILLDGLADRSHPGLSGMTPLEAAATPRLDTLAREGACGHFHALSPGVPLSSEAAHFFMMGYGPEEFPGRGPLEALGWGIPLQPGEVALLAHLGLARRAGGRLVLDQRKPRLPGEEAPTLMAAVGSFEHELGQVRLHRTSGSSGVLVLSGEGLDPRITDSDPLLPGRPLLQPRPWREAQGSPEAARACDLLAAYLRWAHGVLAAHPINQEHQARGELAAATVITQRAGCLPQVPSLAQRWGLRVLSISSAPIYRGVFTALGAEAELTHGLPDPGDDLAAKLDTALARLEDFDLIHVHSKAPDQTAHTKIPTDKRDVISSLDAGLAGLRRGAREAGAMVAVTGDHSTPSSGDMIHSGEPSPLLLWGPAVWRDAATAFSETACAAGALGLLQGPALMRTLLCLLDRGKLYGMRDDPRDLPYYPGPDDPLIMDI